MAVTISEKADAMISKRQIYSPEKQRELGNNCSTNGPESLVKVNYCKILRIDFFFLNEGIFILRTQKQYHTVLTKSGFETKAVTMRKNGQKI